MTIYNDKTYRVDEIEWNANPTCKFPYKGSEISYMDYYKKVRNTGYCEGCIYILFLFNFFFTYFCLVKFLRLKEFLSV